MRNLKVALILPVLIYLNAFANEAITIQKQGNFFAGGVVVRSEGEFDDKNITNPAGQTLNGDHASVYYQIPQNPRKYSLTFLHGAGQSAATWGTTPDGREGFATTFLRRRFSVYLLDQPRRGRAGQSSVPMQITATPQNQMWFNTFRVGIYPNYFEGVQFAKDAESLNQYFRQMTPNTGPFDASIISDAVAACAKRSGDTILITHSQGGGPGWLSRIKSDGIKAIVSYEPGSGFVFPKGEVPDPMPSSAGELSAVGVELAEFKRLTQIPIVIYYGDFIPSEPSANAGQDGWRVRLKMARLWADKINQYGGNAKVVHLPEIGIKGNTHFLFSDLNSDEIAKLLLEWLKENKLD